MKKKTVCYLTMGSLLFLAGAVSAYFLDVPWSFLLLFFGACLLCLPPGIPEHGWWEDVFYSPGITHCPIPREALFLAQKFLAHAWLVRKCGFLSLVDCKEEENYQNSLYHVGKSMVIDGNDIDYVQSTLKNALRTMRQRVSTQAQYLRQFGICLLSIALLCGITVAFVCFFRDLAGRESLLDGLACFSFLIILLCMLSALFTVLIPSKLMEDARKELQIQRQVLAGWDSLQRGESPDTILKTQVQFLSEEEVSMLVENPVPESLKEHPDIQRDEKCYEEIVDFFRQSIKKIGKFSLQ